MEVNSAIIIVLCILALFLVIRWWYGRTEDVFHARYYFDNNGTTRPHDSVIKAVADGMRLGNASAVYASTARDSIKNACQQVLQWLQVQADQEGPRYEVVFTSGASESNNLIIRSMVDRWHLDFTKYNKGVKVGQRPHIVLSSVEHKTSLECVKDLVAQRRCTATFVPCGPDGRVPPAAVEASIRPETILVTIMHANNETGAINDIRDIATRCFARKVPFHTDAVQTFGKFPTPVDSWNIWALSASFHKMYGPMGLGILLLRRGLARDNNFRAQIAGSQNSGLRGGTENVPAIVGAAEAMRVTFSDRPAKNAQLLAMKNVLVTELTSKYEILDFNKFIGKHDEDMSVVPAGKSAFGVVFLGPVLPSGLPHPNYSLPNTLLFSIVTLADPEKPYEHFCNIKLKERLEKQNVSISIGSACNTGVAGPSHVILNTGAPFIIRCGVIRMSIGDHNTLRECHNMMKIFHSAVAEQTL